MVDAVAGRWRERRGQAESVEMTLRWGATDMCKQHVTCPYCGRSISRIGLVYQNRSSALTDSPTDCTVPDSSTGQRRTAPVS